MSQPRRSPRAGIRPELELLLCCAQASTDSERGGRITALLQEQLDWKYLLATARRHRIMPLLYQSLVSACPQGVPPAVLEQLEDLFRNNVRRSFFLTGELLRCLASLDAQGIPAVPYKGPLLAALTHGDFALRQFDDLDILVHEQDVLKARDLFVSQGYRPEFQLNRAQEAAYLRDYSAYQVVRAEGMIVVELHWRITETYFSFPLVTDELWERLEVASLAGREVRTLSPEDSILILCAHATKHVWTRLAWICDVAKLIGAHQDMHWARVMERAAMLGSERMLFLGLFLASDLLGAAVPEQVLERVRAEPAVVSLAGQVRERLLRDSHDQPGNLESCLFHLKARERWQDRVRYCVRLAVTTTPGDWASVRLPAALFPVYYLLRPFRLVGQYAPGLWRRC